MAITKRLRFEILRRDNHTCRYCGGTAPDVTLVVDHVVPVALGGTDLPENLVAACRDCNSGKSATPADAAMVAQVSQDAVRWADAMLQATDLALEQLDNRNAMRDSFREHWDTFTYGSTYYPKQVPLLSGWQSTIDRFIAAGLSIHDIYEGVDIAMAGPASPDATWKYFCGVMWTRLRDRQEVARQILAAKGEVD